MDYPRNNLRRKPGIVQELADKSQTEENRALNVTSNVLPYLQTAFSACRKTEKERGRGLWLIVDLNDRMAHRAVAPALATHGEIARRTTGTDGNRNDWLVSHSHKGNLSQALIITICHSPESIEMTNEDQKPR